MYSRILNLTTTTTTVLHRCIVLKKKKNKALSLLAAAQRQDKDHWAGDMHKPAGFLGHSSPAGELRALLHHESFNAGCFQASHALFLTVVLMKVHVSRNRGRVRMPASDIIATYLFSTYPVPDSFPTSSHEIFTVAQKHRDILPL